MLSRLGIDRCRPAPADGCLARRRVAAGPADAARCVAPCLTGGPERRRPSAPTPAVFRRCGAAAELCARVRGHVVGGGRRQGDTGHCLARRRGAHAPAPVVPHHCGGGSPELFAAATLLVVLGTAWGTAQAGLSMPLGAFLAGLMLAGTEYRHQIEADTRPVRALLLRLFFLSTGMLIDFRFLAAELPTIAALTAALILVKAAIVVPLGCAFGRGSRWRSMSGFTSPKPASSHSCCSRWPSKPLCCRPPRRSFSSEWSLRASC